MRKPISERVTITIKGGCSYRENILFSDILKMEGALPTDVISKIGWKRVKSEGWGMSEDDDDNYLEIPTLEVYRERIETDDEYFKRMKESETIKAELLEKERLEYLRLKAKFE